MLTCSAMDRPLYIAGPPPPPQPKGPAEWGKLLHRPLHRPITDLKEQELVARVLSDPHYRHLLMNIKDLFSTNARVLREVQLRAFKSELTSDLDILVIPADAPDQSTAIQVKRFVPQDGLEYADAWRPNRMQRLFKEGIRQANETLGVGFSQVYLWVFVLIDTREQNGGRYTYDGPDSALRARIQQAMSPVRLDPRVGLMDFEWVQPMDRAPFELGTYGGHLERLAENGTQPGDLTEWIRTPAQDGQGQSVIEVAVESIPTLRCPKRGCRADAVLRRSGVQTSVRSRWKCPICGSLYVYEHRTERLAPLADSER